MPGPTRRWSCSRSAISRGLTHYEARMSDDIARRRSPRRADMGWPRSCAGRHFCSHQSRALATRSTLFATRRSSPSAARTVLAGCPAGTGSAGQHRARDHRASFPSAVRCRATISSLPWASLPKLFGTRIETIPDAVPYMSADPQRVEQWRQRLAGDANIKVGIAWAGSSAHQNDRARSCTLTDFAPLAAVEGVTLYSLQKGPAADELKSVAAGMNIIPLGHESQRLWRYRSAFSNASICSFPSTPASSISPARSRGRSGRLSRAGRIGAG